MPVHAGGGDVYARPPAAGGKGGRGELGERHRERQKEREGERENRVV